MQCFHRKLGFFVPTGPSKGIYFGKRPRGLSIPVYMPCGKCRACRINKANEWAIRCYHESLYTADDCCLTLTYDNEHLPSNLSVVKEDVQKFLKRVRRHLDYHGLPPLRAYMAVGEYGKIRHRPHYHLILFGWKPDDLIFFKRSASGVDMYNSATLSALWPLGWSVVQDCSVKSAAYVARYSKKMICSDCEDAKPPFCLTSRNIRLTNGEQGALGAQFLLDFVGYNGLNLPYFTVDGKRKYPIPRYYLKLLDRWFPEERKIIVEMKRQYLQGDMSSAIDGYVLAYVGETREAVHIDGHQLSAEECDYWTKRLLEAEEFQNASMARLTRPLEI